MNRVGGKTTIVKVAKLLKKKGRKTFRFGIGVNFINSMAQGGTHTVCFIDLDKLNL